MDIFLNRVIQFYSNNTINLRHLSQRIISLYIGLPTKWRSYRDHRLCDITSPYILGTGARASLDFLQFIFANSLWTLAYKVWRQSLRPRPPVSHIVRILCTIYSYRNFIALKMKRVSIFVTRCMRISYYIMCVWLALFRCCFVPLLAPNPGDPLREWPRRGCTRSELWTKLKIATD